MTQLPAESDQSSRRRSRAIIAVFLAAVGVVLATGFMLGYVPRKRASMLDQEKASLERRATLTRTAIELWVSAAVVDCRTAASHPHAVEFASGKEALADPGHLSDVLQIEAKTQELSTLLVYRRVDGAMIVAGEGSEPANRNSECAELAQRAIASRSVVVDVHGHEDGTVDVAIAAPVVVDGDPEPVGAVVFERSPKHWLYPFLLSTVSDGGLDETLLLENIDDTLRLISPRHGEAAPTFKPVSGLALTPVELDAATSEAVHTVKFVGAHGTKRLAVFRRIEGAPWIVLVQSDYGRIEKSIQRQLVRDGLLVAALFAILASIALLIVSIEARHLRRVDRRLAAVMSHANDAILFVGRDGAIYEANRRAERMYRLDRAELCSRSLSDLRAHGQEEETSDNVLIDSESSGRRTFRTNHRDARGNVFPVEISTRLTEIDGTHGFIVVVRDVSESVAAEAELRRFQDELEQRVAERTAQLADANRELEAFSYSVSHDLRAPLRAIDGFAKILEEEHAPALDAEGRRVLSVIRTSAKRMGRLIDDLLEFSRVGRREIHTGQVDMNEIVEAVVAELAAERPECASRFRRDDLLPASGDPMLLRQVWHNLLSNAVKFAPPPRERAIEIGSRLESARVVYFVRDYGVGFNMKYASKLFGVFQRLHSVREFEGTGVGLALVQRIVRRHGGEVWAEAEVDKGATFYFSLPTV